MTKHINHVRNVEVRTRTDQVCSVCGRKIKAGRLSIHEKGIREGRWVSRYLCIGCSEEIGGER